MNLNLTDELKTLNTDLALLINRKVSIARQYFNEKYPFLMKGNIIIHLKQYTFQEDLIFIINHNITLFKDRNTREYINEQISDGHYFYIPENNIEKEFYFNIDYSEVLKSGISKKNPSYVNNIFDTNRTKLICNLSEFDKMCKENNIKPKLNKTNLLLLFGKIDN